MAYLQYRHEECLARLYLRMSKINKGRGYRGGGVDFEDGTQYIEFTTGGKVDTKDFTTYCEKARKENLPYKIVFVDGKPPHPLLIETLSFLGIQFEVWDKGTPLWHTLRKRCDWLGQQGLSDWHISLYMDRVLNGEHLSKRKFLLEVRQI